MSKKRAVAWTCITMMSCAHLPRADEPVRGYRHTTVAGYRVFVNDAVTAHARESAQILPLLEKRLLAMLAALSPEHRKVLARPTIWIEWKSALGPKDILSFVGGATELAEAGIDTAKAHSIEVSSSPAFLKEVPLFPHAVLHEFAHYYHHFVLGEDNAEIHAAFLEAAASRRYDFVCYGFAHKIQRSTAIADEWEYFAESTAAWFGCNRTYPFNRPQLQRFDPRMYAIVDRVWSGSRATTEQCPVLACPEGDFVTPP